MKKMKNIGVFNSNNVTEQYNMLSVITLKLILIFSTMLTRFARINCFQRFKNIELFFGYVNKFA